MGVLDFSKYYAVLEEDYVKKTGRVSRLVGLTIESAGPDIRMGGMCVIHSAGSPSIPSEVVGFRDNHILLMPLGDMVGISPGSLVESSGKPVSIKVGASLLGRVLDGLGQPMDGKGPLAGVASRSVLNTPPDPLFRNRITEPLTLGVKSIDGLLTIGKGQRVGIFAGTGVGKSTLMGMIARNTSAEVNVIGLIGERGREVREFLERDLGEEGLKRSVVVIASSDKPPLVRVMAALVATPLAEYFRDQGKDVLLLMDSLTRYAMALREIGLAIGEPPVSKGYTPSVFSTMPKLLERAGNSDIGSITGLYTVLVDGDDLTEPVTDAVRGILDGHIVLSRKLANRNQYPAVDILASISRVMPDVIDAEHKKNAGILKKSMAVYSDSEDLINIGAYVKGSSPEIDDAIQKHDPIVRFLEQAVEERFSFEGTLEQMRQIVA
jgi:flagellum-specific ATP synthase